jgi:hypothetical protein
MSHLTYRKKRADKRENKIHFSTYIILMKKENTMGETKFLSLLNRVPVPEVSDTTKSNSSTKDRPKKFQHSNIKPLPAVRRKKIKIRNLLSRNVTNPDKDLRTETKKLKSASEIVHHLLNGIIR